MWGRNEGQSRSDILQNRFTAYVTTAIRRQRNAYIQKLNEKSLMESIVEYEQVDSAYSEEEQIFAELPLLMQLENVALLGALKGLTEQERHLFLSRVLDGKDFDALAAEYGMQYKGVTTAYYRIIKKIRKLMEEVENGF